MAYEYHQRLTALDELFLDLESESVHMHVGSVGIFEAGPLANADGGIDMERIRAMSGAAMRRNPRFRQKLLSAAVTGHRAWIDDPHFNLDYHLRHTGLPEPGNERQLKRLAGRIFSQKLDLSKPLWEMWFVEGLEGGRFAVITKIHHCMIDGVSGADLLAAFMRMDRETGEEAPASEERWIPRPAPSPLGLMREDLLRRALLPARAAAGLVEGLRRPLHFMERAADTAGGVLEAATGALHQSSETPLNVPIGPHRRFDWMRLDLGDVKEVKRTHGGTVNDVVLAVVTGALRRYLERHEAPVDELDLRALVPVSTRSEDQHGKLGNRVAFLLTPLPVDVARPRARLQRIVETTRELKASKQVAGGEALGELSDQVASGLLAGMSRASARSRAFNLTVTNVPGPQFPVYLAGSLMTETYPLVPLFENEALGIALFSYDGGLFIGLNADWDALPDLHDLVDDLGVAFEELRKH